MKNKKDQVAKISFGPSTLHTENLTIDFQVGMTKVVQ